MTTTTTERVKKVKQGMLRDLWSVLMDERVSVHPPAIAFHLLAFVVPFVLVVVAALGYFFDDADARKAVAKFMLSQMPSRVGGAGSGIWSANLVDKVLAPVVEHRQTAALAGVSVLYVTGSALMQTMRLALNQIFEIPIRRHSLMGRVYAIAAFGFVGSIVFLAAVAVWGFSIIVPHILPWIGVAGDKEAEVVTQGVTLGVLLASNLGILYGLYRYLPDQKPTVRTALIGSLLCTTALIAARWVSGMLLERSFEDYNVVYGAYAALALAAVWLYYVAFIFTVCAAFGRTLDENLAHRHT